MRIFRRPRGADGDSSASEFLWGVPRREGLSDTDDPVAHASVVQHAFELGVDDRAICGFEPPKRPTRAYRDPRPQLAVPGRDNPKCRKCELLVASRTIGDHAGATATETSARGDAAAAEEHLGPAPEPAPPPGARTPGFQPRGPAARQLDADDDELQSDQEIQQRARRRSVRRGGTVVVAAGRRSVVIEVPVATGFAGIVANVEPEIDDMRVEAVTVSNDGTARITLNRPAPDQLEIGWYIVSNPLRETG